MLSTPGHSGATAQQEPAREGRLNLEPGKTMFYRIDDCVGSSPPCESVFFVHGIGESGAAWAQWVPHFTPWYRVIRIDQRGFGQSTPMPKDFPWSLDQLASDLILAIGELAPGAPVHVVAAKAGGAVAIKAATLRPDLVSSLTLAGTPVVGPDTRSAIEHIEQHGLRRWAQDTFDARFGTQLDGATREWWIDLMSATPLPTIIGFLRFVSSVDVTNLLPLLSCPTQVLATDSRRRPWIEFVAWQHNISGSSILWVPGDGYHAAACNPEFCASATVAFLQRLSRS